MLRSSSYFIYSHVFYIYNQVVYKDWLFQFFLSGLFAIYFVCALILNKIGKSGYLHPVLTRSEERLPISPSTTILAVALVVLLIRLRMFLALSLLKALIMKGFEFCQCFSCIYWGCNVRVIIDSYTNWKVFPFCWEEFVHSWHCFFLMFDRVHQWGHLGLEISLCILITNSP